MHRGKAAHGILVRQANAHFEPYPVPADFHGGKARFVLPVPIEPTTHVARGHHADKIRIGDEDRCMACAEVHRGRVERDHAFLPERTDPASI